MTQLGGHACIYRERGGRCTGGGGSGGSRRGRGRGDCCELVAVLRQLWYLLQELPAVMPMPGRLLYRVPPNVQAMRQVHRRRRRPDPARPPLPLRGYHHELLQAPLHAVAAGG